MTIRSFCLRFLLISLAFPCLATPSRAIIIGEEVFSYPDGPLAGKTGGNFWNWKNSSDSAGAPRRTSSSSDWDDLRAGSTVSGGKLITTDSSVKREYNGPGEGPPIESDEGRGAINNFSNSSLSFQEHVIYYRITFTTGAKLPLGFGISSYDFGTERVFFGKTFGNSELGIEVPNGVVSSSVQVQPNATYTLVAKLDYPAGKASLLINPDLSAATEPSPSVSVNFDTSKWSTALRLSSGGSTAVTWDDLRVATTWKDLAPVVITTAVDEDDFSMDPTAQGGTGISLREALNYAPADSLITFAPGLSGKTIVLTRGEMLIPSAATLDATSLPRGITVDANHNSRHFTVETGKSLTLRGLTLTGGCIAGNTGGGAIDNYGTLQLDRCTLTDNTSASMGALAQFAGSVTLSHCTVSGNAGTNDSATGGIIAFDGLLTLNSCTISQNTGKSCGGIFQQAPATVNISNSIIAGNTGGTHPDIHYQGGSLTAGGSNLIGVNTSVGDKFPAGPLAGTAAAPLDPKLSPPGWFGGPVMTLHPLIGSPAIDSAGATDPGGTDARGFPRFADGNTDNTAAPDIGAVEAGPLIRVDSTSDDTGFTLRNLLAVANTPGARIGFPAGLSGSTITLTQGELAVAAGKSLFIDASDLAAPVTLSGNNTSRVFNIAEDATLALHSLKIVNGQAYQPSVGAQAENGGNGGGILNSGSLSLFRSTISGCRTGNGAASSGGVFQGGGEGGHGGHGGGIFSSGRLSLTACTLSGNVTGNGSSGNFAGGDGGNGGAICNSGRQILTSCTLSGNITGNGSSGSFLAGKGGSGGGIRNDGAGAFCRLSACTIAENRTGSGGGRGAFDDGQAADGQGGGVSGGLVILQNSLIAGNHVPPSAGATADLYTDSLNFQGPNLLGTAAASGSPATGPAPLVSSSPLLSALGDYGGLTQTIPLLPRSPALNAAAFSALTTDQRGIPITGVPDLGAFEARYEDLHDLTVTTTEDEDNGSLNPAADGGAGLSLREAMLYALDNSTITFDPSLSGKTITLTSRQLPLARGFNIDASAMTGGLTLDAALRSRHFHVPQGKILSLAGLTLLNGDGTGDGPVVGGSIFNEGELGLQACTFLTNSASGDGGAVYCGGSAKLHALHTGFSNNKTRNAGGAVSVQASGSATLEQCQLTGNTAQSDGGAVSSNGTTGIRDCAFSENTAGGFGGAVVAGSGQMTLDLCTLSQNTADHGAGAAIYSDAQLQASDCTLQDNTATEAAGGISLTGGKITLTRCTLSGNTAPDTGALLLSDGAVSATLNHCTVTGNLATGGSATGGIRAAKGTLTLSCCTISQNTGNGGGGGLAFLPTASIALESSILAGNADRGGTAPDLYTVLFGNLHGFATVTGHNLIGNNTSAEDFFPPGPLVGTADQPLDPKLSPPGYFGGSVMTLHPLIGSPAIDADSATDPGGTDARGFPRFMEGDSLEGTATDIGAVEAGLLLTVTNADDADGTGPTLRGAINYATAPGAAAGMRISFGPGFSGPINLTLGEITIPATPGVFIDASNIPGGVTVSGGGKSRVFNITSEATTAMHSVKIINGQAPDGASSTEGSSGGSGGNGGGILNGGSLSLFSCTLQDNHAGGGGRSVKYSEPGPADNGGAGGSGGAIYSDGPLTFTACTLATNSAGAGADCLRRGTAGDGGRGGAITSTGPLSLTACTLTKNFSGPGGRIDDNDWSGRPGDHGDGGGIFKTDLIPFSLTACTVVSNVASRSWLQPGGNHGTGHGLAGGVATLRNCLFADNYPYGLGGPVTQQPEVKVHSLHLTGGNILALTPEADSSITGPAPIISSDSKPGPLGDYGGPTQTMPLLPGSPARDAAGPAARVTDQRGFPLVGTADLGAFESQFGLIPDTTTPEDTPTAAIPFSTGRIGTLSVESGNPDLVPATGVVLGDTGGSRSVTVTPAPNQNGTALIRIVDSFTGEATEFTLTVTPVNDSPLAASDTITRYPTQGVKVPLATLLANDTDPDGDSPLAITAVSPTSGHNGTVTTDTRSGIVFYTPAPGFKGADSFTYTLSDGHGGSATGIVNVDPVRDDAAGMNITEMALQADGAMRVGFAAIPGRTYQIQTSENLTDWTTRATVTADEHGGFSFSDPAPLPLKRFYRSVQP